MSDETPKSTETPQIPDIRRWFKKITPCKKIDAEVKMVDMGEFNLAWKPKYMSIPIVKADGKE